MGTSLEMGRRAGTVLAAGMVTGTLVWGALTALGLTALLTTYALALTLIKLAGAVYLLWLAFQSFRSAFSMGPTPGVARLQTVSPGQLYRRGLLIQLSNPKAVLTWLAIVSLAAGDQSAQITAAAAVVGCFFISLVGHMTDAVALPVPTVGHAYLRIRRTVQIGLGAFYCFANGKLATSRM